ncbi:MAG: GAF domain-containing protein, partial [Planctomycetes bacterium]|nr:GAF domain-containing protein [Planctomycetota bacterium]
VNLVDLERQWSKASHGCPRGQLARERSFGTHTIASTETLVVRDARAEDRFADHPQVTGDPGIRFYAGQPLIDGDGHALGSLCVFDRAPRGLDEHQRTALARLSRHAVHLMELHRSNAELIESLSHVRAIARLVPMCAHCHAVRDEADQWQRIERYLQDLHGIKFTHGVCPACLMAHYTGNLAATPGR